MVVLTLNCPQPLSNIMGYGILPPFWIFFPLQFLPCFHHMHNLCSAFRDVDSEEIIYMSTDLAGGQLVIPSLRALISFSFPQLKRKEEW